MFNKHAAVLEEKKKQQHINKQITQAPSCTFAVESLLAETTHFPSGLNCILLMTSL